MPLPLVPIIIVAGVALSAALGGVVYWQWDEIREFLHGKEFAVLGQRKVGKTTLIHFIRTGEVNSAYRPTLVGEEFEMSRRVLEHKSSHGGKSIQLKMSEGIDVAGQKAAYASWRRVTKTADVLVYLFRADLVLAEDQEHLSRLKADAGQIGKWIDGRNEKPMVFLIGTYCDLSDEFDDVEDEDTIKYYQDAFGEHPAIKNAHRKLRADAAVVLGSLKDEACARGLVFQLFQNIETVDKSEQGR